VFLFLKAKLEIGLEKAVNHYFAYSFIKDFFEKTS